MSKPTLEEIYADALDHIMRVARQAVRPTRRLDWIAARAQRALAGKDFKMGELPRMPKNRRKAND